MDSAGGVRVIPYRYSNCAPRKVDFLERGIDALELEICRILRSEGVAVNRPTETELIVWSDREVKQWRDQLKVLWQQSAGPLPDWLQDPVEPPEAKAHLIENWPTPSLLVKGQSLETEGKQ